MSESAPDDDRLDNSRQTADQPDATLRILVATVTRRALSLEALLRSWRDMTHPARCAVDFLVVENDDTDGARSLVEEFGRAFEPKSLSYVRESTIGIPFARNRAAREALAGGYHLLAFVDDDETVARDWLPELVEAYRTHKTALLGGPVRMAAQDLDDPASTRMSRSLALHYRRRERRAERAAQRGYRVTVVTNNWLAETTLFSEHDIWFDTELRFSGGSDARFFDRVVAEGLPTGWVPNARVCETVPVERLSFDYQHRRARDQTIAWIHRKLDSNRAYAVVFVALLFWNSLAIVPLAISLPLTRDVSLVPFARALGRISGVLAALLGKRSNLYRY